MIRFHRFLCALLLAFPAPLVSADLVSPTRDTAIPPSSLERQDWLKRLGVDAWQNLGYRGKGIKVAILDSGFRGYRDYLGKELPAKTIVRSFRKDGNLEARDSQHGILCGELVHTLAPDAELLLANWDSESPDQFLAAVRWAREQGAKILSCSVITPAWSDGEGNGKVHQQLRKLLTTEADAALCFASAGNTAQRHWSGTIHEGANHCHLWAPDQTENPLSPWGSEQVSVELCWQSGSDLELAVRDVESEKEVAQPIKSKDADRCSAEVRFMPEAHHSYEVEVKHLAGPASHFHLTALGSGLKYATAAGSIPFPGDGSEVIAVGAVDRDGHRWSYSSCGPNSTSPKPDLVATVPVRSSIRDRSFGGTSAAAPQAAALAALIWSRHPDWSADKVRQILQQAAQDLGPPGHDFETGYGLIRLP